jgi:DNA-binding NarL/FixJ family response regulator
MLKDATREELLDCIRKVSSGKTRISPPMVTKQAEDKSISPNRHRLDAGEDLPESR